MTEITLRVASSLGDSEFQLHDIRRTWGADFEGSEKSRLASLLPQLVKRASDAYGLGALTGDNAEDVELCNALVASASVLEAGQDMPVTSALLRQAAERIELLSKALNQGKDGDD